MFMIPVNIDPDKYTKMRTYKGEKVLIVRIKMKKNIIKGIKELQIYSLNHYKRIGCLKAANWHYLGIIQHEDLTDEALLSFVWRFLYYREHNQSHEDMVGFYNKVIRNGGLTAYVRKLESTIDKRECL